MASQIKEQIRAYILDNFMMGSDVHVADDASFIDNHIIDSTGFLELIMFLEQTFKIKVKDNEMIPENLDSLNNIADYLARKQEG